MENLPDIQLDGREVVDDDSDVEVDPKALLQEPLVEAGLPLAALAQNLGQLGARALPAEVPAPLEVATTKRFKRNRAGPPPPQPWPWRLLSKFLPSPGLPGMFPTSGRLMPKLHY